MSQFVEDLHEALSGVLRSHGAGLLSRAVLLVEVFDEDSGELGMFVETSPQDMPAWDRAGMVSYASLDLAGHLTASRLQADDGDDREGE
ncbi:hypothetical protein GCM10009760_16390 [Kitasatospora kazusensis]|uniref:Uncharacterized protein n=1 Tax=Kitasatospora kazusensis TaxID=407974 RepID=A0ABN2Z4Q6_9ACTN